MRSSWRALYECMLHCVAVCRSAPVLQQREEEAQVAVAEGGLDGHQLGQRQQRRRPQVRMRRHQRAADSIRTTTSHIVICCTVQDCVRAPPFGCCRAAQYHVARLPSVIPDTACTASTSCRRIKLHVVVAGLWCAWRHTLFGAPMHSVATPHDIDLPCICRLPGEIICADPPAATGSGDEGHVAAQGAARSLTTWPRKPN